MTRKWVLAAVIICLLPLAGRLWAQSEFFRIEDLRPGMKGIGKTCYQGSKTEEFQVEILGVMRHISPGGDAVLARLTGGPLSETGVFEGMSGSPVSTSGCRSLHRLPGCDGCRKLTLLPLLNQSREKIKQRSVQVGSAGH